MDTFFLSQGFPLNVTGGLTALNSKLLNGHVLRMMKKKKFDAGLGAQRELIEDVINIFIGLNLQLKERLS